MCGTEQLSYIQAVEFEKESNNVVKFTVPARSVARILGKAGATINDIKDASGVQIDVDKAQEDNDNANISIRGTKKAIAEAKAAIVAIADQVAEETTATIDVPSKFHRTIIGAGGQGLKDLIARCGGPTDSKAQAGLIRLCVNSSILRVGTKAHVVPCLQPPSGRAL